jgi:hypothetical protein
MLGYAPYYWQTIRRNVVCFGNIFKDITLVKYNRETRNEIDQRIVPLVYAGKENYLTRLESAPELPRPVELVLPSLSFMINSLTYDPSRKLQSSLQNLAQGSGGGNSVLTQYGPVPYNLGFELNIYHRNIDDGLQILEQILPFFNPDYTLTMSFVDEMNITRNIPLILNNIDIPTEFEGDATQTERRLVWTLNFTMQTYLYGPVTQAGLITQATANTIYFSQGTQDEEALVLTTSNTALGTFALGETIYQGGTSLATANAVGTVSNWQPNGHLPFGNLTVTIVSGSFVANANVYGINYGSTVEVLSVPSELILVMDVETTNPANANINADFGFVSTIYEFPHIP